MTINELIPAAQYLRMSTEHQQYSIDNQMAAIRKYAQAHGFDIVHTYQDAAKSGVVLRHRAGLQQLLRDVVSGTPAYRAILVYDVSRWGRFQDTDESAHYEFLCKSAGVPVHYCAETFTNDASLPNLIMKALKRTMAGEYSRELGVKILAGQKHLVSLGFKQGGRAGYGLRRMLVSQARVPKQELAFGERKSISTDRVTFVLGPSDEVECVRDIYRMLVSEKRSVYAIARELNQRSIPYHGTSKWDYQAVYNILTHPKYTGCLVFGRTSSRLYTPSVMVPESEWTVTRSAFPPIIDEETFEKAQTILKSRTIRRTNEEMLRELKKLLVSRGKLSLRLIQACPNVPSPSTFRHRFGSLRSAYDRIGYGLTGRFENIDSRRRTDLLRQQLISRILETFPNEISTIKRGGRWRVRLRLANGRNVSVLIARSLVGKGSIHWQIDPVRHERKLITLLARLDEKNAAFFDFHVLPCIDRSSRFRISTHDAWLRRGRPLENLRELCNAVQQIATKGKCEQSRR